MASNSEPFLSSRTSDSKCLICGEAIVIRSEKKYKKRIQFKDDLSALKVQARLWHNLDIPEDNRLHCFTFASSRIDACSSGHVHTNCLSDFRNKRRYEIFDEKVIEDELLIDDEPSDNQPEIPHCTRSVLATPSNQCFVCESHSGQLSRISKESVAQKLHDAKCYHLKNANSRFYIAAKRLELVLQGPAVDVFAADVYYHNQCLQQFVRFQEDKITETDLMIEFVKNYFSNYVYLKICKEKNAYLLCDLLNDSKIMSEDHDVEHVFTNTKSLRRYLENHVNDIGFVKSGRNVIVYPTDVDPIMYSTSTLKGHGLRKKDIIRAFAKMIQRAGDQYSTKDHLEWPASANDLMSAIENDKPISELYNTIFMTVNRKWKNSVSINEHGFAKIESTNLAKKIWSIASDWTALVTGLKNSKQISLGLYIHRLTANKEVANVLWKAGHAISPNDIRLQNEEFLLGTTYMGGILSELKLKTVTHSSLDNNDMCQDTSTGKNTSHHTNFLIFQPNPPVDGTTVSSSPASNLLSEHSEDGVKYAIGKLTAPPLLPNYIENHDSNLIEDDFRKNILWSLAGGMVTDNELPLLGSWTAFMKNTCNQEALQSLVKYLPANENPPEYGVCKKYLEFILEVMGCLDVPRVFVHADEQVYARIVQLIWKYKDRFQNIIPLMGGFHQLRVFQRILFKRHAVVGYQDWFSDSGVVAAGSAPAAFEGRHYYRSMRIHKEGFDALAQYRIEEITDNYKSLSSSFKDLLKTLRMLPSNGIAKELMENEEFQTLTMNFQMTTDSKSRMTMQYMKDVSLMLSIVSAVRENNFEKHLQAERKLLELIFAFDHVNYARYNTYQHLLLTNLKNDSDDAYYNLVSHGFGCTTTRGRFSTKHGDLETEHFNRETKGTAGPFRSGYSTNIQTVNRWIKTAHIHATLRKIVKQHFRLYTSSVHKELTPKNKKNHQTHVQLLKQKLRDYNIDPFGVGPARNFVSGKEIKGTIVDGLLDAGKIGETKYLDFVANRFVNGNQSFFDPVSKNNIDTGMAKQKKQSKKIDILLEEKQAFGIMVAKCKSKEEGFSFPMTSIPLSIANPNRTLYSSGKAKFRNYLIGNSFVEVVNIDAVWIVDAGFAIRQVKPKETYREFFANLLKWTLPSRDLYASEIIITVDDYRKESTKEGERRNRRNGRDEGVRVFVTGLEQKMPREKMKWNDFLSNGENKNDLMSLFGMYLKTEEAIDLADGIKITFCGRDRIWVNGKEIGRCNHEEADTKIPYFASLSSKNVVAVAQDCDVLILLISAYAMAKPNAKWFLKYDVNRFADIKTIHDFLGDKVSRNLLKYHAISGTDTTSYFYRIGKTAPFKKAMSTNKLFLISMLGDEKQLSSESVDSCKEFIRTVIYKGKENETYLETRIRLYETQPTGSKTTLTIPPDEESCVQHILRCHYRCYTWRRCLQPLIDEIDPYENGWKLESGIAIPVWFTGPQFPPSCQNRRRKRISGYVADDEEQSKRKRLDTPKVSSGRKFRRSLESIQSTEITTEVCVCVDETETESDSVEVFYQNTLNDGDDEKEDSTQNSESSDEWEHLSEFEISTDSSDSDWN